jgi:hypothetical protein
MQDDFGTQIPPAMVSTIASRFDEGAERMGRIEGDMAAVRTELAENTRATRDVAASTAELVEFFEAMRGAFRVLSWLGMLAKPLGAIAALVAALVAVASAMKGAR